MKKILLTIILFCFLTTMAVADIMPGYTDSIKYYGMGVINAMESFNIHEKPDTKSKIVKRIDFEEHNNTAIIGAGSLEGTVVAYVPMSKVALVCVETNNEDGWFEVYYDQKNGLTGWVKQDNTSNFKTWRDTFYYWGKKNGIYLFKDIPEDYKRMYSKDDLKSQQLESFTIAKHMNFSIIRGNWMLVSILDIGPSQRTKIGWMRWRQDDGKLLMFPHFR